MTLEEVRDFLGFRYTNELAEHLSLHPVTVYRWKEEGIPYRHQKKFAKQSRGKLTISLTAQSNRKPKKTSADQS